MDVSGVRSEEDEWNDFAAEHQADYSGLRIQKLNIQEDAADEEEEVGMYSTHTHAREH